jgi:phospholipid/cholesterol/gamma-HCH transport system substrate-binding protein
MTQKLAAASPLTKLVTVAIVLALAGAAIALMGPEQRRLSMMFPSTTSLYEGAQVKVLGVTVGRVDSIRVVGTQVRVEMEYDSDVKLPAGVHGVVVPPSIVGDRFIQLAPAYTTGPVLPDGAHLDASRASIPLELDDTYRALDQVARSLGPNGANRDGAVADLISAGAENLRGRGQLFNDAVRNLADAIAVVAGSSEDFNGTTTNLARLSRELAGSDDSIRSLAVSLVAVSTELSGQRAAMSSAVTSLNRALKDVGRMTKDNRSALTQSTDDLRSVSAALRRHTSELEEIVDLAPVGLNNLMNIYVPRNWDPTNPSASNINGRTGSQNLHAQLFEDLGVQLGYAVTAACNQLPPEAAAQMAPLCTALQAAGGDLGSVLGDLYHRETAP